MNEMAYCDRCETETREEELIYPTADYILWAKALGMTPESICDACAEEDFDREQEKLAKGMV